MKPSSSGCAGTLKIILSGVDWWLSLKITAGLARTPARRPSLPAESLLHKIRKCLEFRSTIGTELGVHSNHAIEYDRLGCSVSSGGRSDCAGGHAISNTPN